MTFNFKVNYHPAAVRFKRNRSRLPLAIWTAVWGSFASAASQSVIAGPESVALVTESRPRMATLVSVTLAGAPPALVRQAMNAAFSAFDRVDEVMNEWRPESPLSALNRSAGGREPVPLPQDLCDLLGAALDGAARTGGLFDPTWAALRDLWRFGDSQPGVPPRLDQIQDRCQLVHHAEVELSPFPHGPGCLARLPRAGMQLGLGGIAKGWGVDESVRRLRALGLRNFVVQAGGDLYAAGTRGGRPWRVGIRDPRGPSDRYFASLEVSDAAFSTSGDYENFYVADGIRYHHIIDPRVCWPARASRSATVLARTAVDAEILTKAGFIAGRDQAFALVEKWNAAIVLVTAANEVAISPRLAGKLKQSASPSP